MFSGLHIFPSHMCMECDIYNVPAKIFRPFRICVHKVEDERHFLIACISLKHYWGILFKCISTVCVMFENRSWIYKLILLINAAIVEFYLFIKPYSICFICTSVWFNYIPFRLFWLKSSTFQTKNNNNERKKKKIASFSLRNQLSS